MRGIECNILDSFLSALLQRPEPVYFLQPRSLQSNRPAHYSQYFNPTKWKVGQDDVVNDIRGPRIKDTLKLFERDTSDICRFNYVSLVRIKLQILVFVDQSKAYPPCQRIKLLFSKHRVTTSLVRNNMFEEKKELICLILICFIVLNGPSFINFGCWLIKF